jgi:hypothetical protein
MKTFFKIIFSPILIAWWLIKTIIRVLAFPITIIWRILRKITPRLTELVDEPVAGIRDVFRR